MKSLIKALEELNISYDDRMIYKFTRYMELILDWNKKINLTTIIDKDEFVMRHYIDSLACCGFYQMQNAEKIIDVGTGAGFPGIPLAIVYPDKEFVLMDSINKKIRIIDEISKELEINNVRFCHGRAEDLAKEKAHREQYDLCASRAVASLAVLSEYCIPFVKVGGWFVAYKSGGTEEEIKNSIKAIEILGGKIEAKESIQMYGFNLDHEIIFINKIKKTLAKYPRKAGTPGKQPLK